MRGAYHGKERCAGRARGDSMRKGDGGRIKEKSLHYVKGGASCRT